MFIENLILFGLILFLVFVLYKALGQKQNTEKQLPEKLRFFSEKTGQIVEMRLMKEPPETFDLAKFAQEEFLLRAKIIYKEVVESFANGDLNNLKTYTADDVFSAFSDAVKTRNEQEQKMEFSLICFNSAEITNVSPENDKVTVAFETEQINLLKNQDDEVAEGDPMSIAKVKDLWTFSKKGKNKWVVCATQSEAVYE